MKRRNDKRAVPGIAGATAAPKSTKASMAKSESVTPPPKANAATKACATPPLKSKKKSTKKIKRPNVFTAPKKRSIAPARAGVGAPARKVSRRLSLNKSRDAGRFPNGTKILKRFDNVGAFFAGTIRKAEREYLTEKMMYHVEYDDGDSEDFYSDEVEKWIAK